MEVNARATKNLKQIRIMKQGTTFSSLMTIADAKKAWQDGKILTYNLTFRRLAANDFNVEKTLQYYRDEREALGHRTPSVPEKVKASVKKKIAKVVKKRAKKKAKKKSN